MRAYAWRLRLAAVLGVGLVGGADAFAGLPPGSGSGGIKPNLGPGYQYQLQWKGGHYVGGFSKTSPVLVTNGSKSVPVYLENGSLGDASFGTWAYGTAKAGTGKGQLQDIRLLIYDKNGILKSGHTYKDCWASEYQAVYPINYKGSGIPVQELMLLCAPSK
jgi:hypothetical protein